MQDAAPAAEGARLPRSARTPRPHPTCVAGDRPGQGALGARSLGQVRSMIITTLWLLRSAALNTAAPSLGLAVPQLSPLSAPKAFVTPAETVPPLTR